MTKFARAQELGNARGAACLDSFYGRDIAPPTLEVDDATSGPAMHPEWFVHAPADWERELLPALVAGTGWAIEHQNRAGADHGVALRRIS